MKQQDQVTKIAIVGANGKMGKHAEAVINAMPGFSIVAKIHRGDNLDESLKTTKPDIAIELTSNLHVYANASTIIRNGVHPIIGASGLTTDEINTLTKQCEAMHLGGLIIPNFSIGIALIANFAKNLTHFFDDISLVEFHHAQKKDKPSGTTKYIAAIVKTDEQQIASIRSNGFLAKHQLYINSKQERIMIDHESFGRNSFDLGIELSIKKIMQLDTMVIGLENLI